MSHLTNSLLKILLIILSLTTSSVFSQQIEINKLKGMKIRSVGPSGMSGRITAIDVVNKNPEIIYAGAASGGVWKSESQGIAWEPVFDKENLQSIGAICIQQSNPDVIWVGTGEGNPRNSLNGGYGIYKSLDAGKTWHLMGLEKTRNIHRIIVDREKPDIVYVAAIGSPWGAHEERGVFKTTDGGKTWQKILYVNQRTGAADLVVDYHNPNKLIAAMWEHNRKPYTFNSGGKGSGLYITYNGGETWTQKTSDDGLPKGELGRIGLAISQSNPKIVYALVEAKKNGLYRSDDGGSNWKLINSKLTEGAGSGIGNRPFYYSDIFVDPENEYRIYSVFTYVNVSIDGGKSFQQLMPAYNTDVGIHPDHHAWWIHPGNPDFMIDGNDGGLNITKDKGKTWRFVENLPVGQFYHINVDNEYPYNLYGGMQDNGSWVGPAYVLKSQGIRNSYWQEILFGDGFDVVPDPKESRFGYGMSQEGHLNRYDRETGAAKLIRPVHPDPDVKLRFNWNSGIAMDPFDRKTIYFGSQFVHKSMNQGHEWEIISPDLTTDDAEKQKQYDSGGLTMDATGAENYCTILAISPSSLSKDELWVGTDDGQIQLTRDGGQHWSLVSPKIESFPRDGWIAQIKVSTHTKGEAYAVVNNYRNFDFRPYLFRTRDYGKTWKNILNGKDETFGYSLSMVQDPIEKKLLFLGTENGLYLSFDEGGSWTKWTEGYPSVPTMDMTIHPRERDLDIATFGRSFYVLDDIRPLQMLARKGVNLLDLRLKLFTPPTAYLAEVQQPLGTRFGANAIYNGENRKKGAMISFIFNKQDQEENSKDKEKGTQNKDSLVLSIFNNKGELIRTLKPTIPEHNGLNRIYWNLDRKGAFSPSRKDVSTKKEPGGAKVLPGTYMLVMQYNELKDSVHIKVVPDPRLSVSTIDLQAKQELLQELYKKKDLTFRAVEQLKTSKKTVEQIKQLANTNGKELYKGLLQQSDSVKKSIDLLIDEVLGKEDKRQGITASKVPSNISYLNKAINYVNELNGPPGNTEKQLIDNANTKLDPVIRDIRAFYSTDWPEYRQIVENSGLTPFQDVPPLE